jgi:hypothetical protein
MSNESREGYAQRRADEVGRPYAVFVNPDAQQFDYAAFDCVDNRRVYAEIGATVVRTFNPVRTVRVRLAQSRPAEGV